MVLSHHTNGTTARDRGTTAGTAEARTRPVVQRQGAVEPLVRYYRAPLRYYRKAGIVKPEKAHT